MVKKHSDKTMHKKYHNDNGESIMLVVQSQQMKTDRNRQPVQFPSGYRPYYGLQIFDSLVRCVQVFDEKHTFLNVQNVNLEIITVFKRKILVIETFHTESSSLLIHGILALSHIL